MTEPYHAALLKRFPIIDSMGDSAREYAQQRAQRVAAAQANSYSNSSGGGSLGASSGSYKGGPGKSLYNALIQGGFSPQAARIMYGIAGAESGYNLNIQGDLGLQNGTWGPSYGTFQIRTLRSQTGTGKDRDINALRNNLARQIRAAYNISNGGRNFRPWTTYVHGTYKKFLPSFNTGAWELPQDTVAELHKGEMVIPPKAAAILRRVVGDPSALGINQQKSMQEMQKIGQQPPMPGDMQNMQQQSRQGPPPPVAAGPVNQQVASPVPSPGLTITPFALELLKRQGLV
jgi:hypothetical protein